ncbi:MAG: helix-turn-helix domain-containing protein [Opitutales bacterium]|nr:helix-turn-helix domain-containing protein [Opitutales bacterium]
MKKSIILLPVHRRLMKGFGENLQLARLRRRLSAERVAERAGISRGTLSSIEAGEPSVAMGNYFQVMRVLGLEKDLAQLAKDDEMGRKLQDLQMKPKKRAPKTKTES